MKLSYDRDVDILRVLLNNKPIQESDEVSEGIIFDYDSAGDPVGFEILDASERVDGLDLNSYVLQLGK